MCVCVRGVVQICWSIWSNPHAVNSQALIGKVLDKLCTQTGLGWSSAPSGDEIFVTLSRQGVVVAMTPSVSHDFTRPPGTFALGARMDSAVQFAGVDRC